MGIHRAHQRWHNSLHSGLAEITIDVAPVEAEQMVLVMDGETRLLLSVGQDAVEFDCAHLAPLRHLADEQLLADCSRH